MAVVVSLPLLRLLRQKRLLKSRLHRLGIDDPRTLQWLLELDSGRSACHLPVPAAIDRMVQCGLVSTAAARRPRGGHTDGAREPSLALVEAVNFELTYDCNWDCQHCIQRGIRNALDGVWMPTDQARQAVRDAWFSGLASAGINFTGGEVFVPASNLPELLEETRSLAIQVRINTNGWWGNRRDIRVGKLRFDTPREVIGWLRECGVAILALSYDVRFEEHPDLRSPVMTVIRECERLGQAYQVVCTGRDNGELAAICEYLVKEAKVGLDRLVPMDMVDLGGASQTEDRGMDPSIADLVGHSPCGGRGFIRPAFLHIAPHGGVRTCLYAPGAQWLGNITRESLIRIINGFPDNAVTAAFSRGDLRPIIDPLLGPYCYLYRHVKHPCGVSALLATIIGESHGRCEGQPIDCVHRHIAAQLNIQSEE